MAIVAVKLLGPVSVSVDGDDLDVPGPLVKGVLSLLGVRVGYAVSDSVLMDDLWGDEPPATARNTLQRYISELRATLGRQCVLREGDGYRLDLLAEQLDLGLFNALLAEAEQLGGGRSIERLALLDQALSLWSGPAFAGARAARIDSFRTEVAERRHRAEERRLDALVKLGRFDAGRSTALRIERDWPYDEEIAVLHAQALLGLTRPTDALHTLDALRTRLREIGLRPGRQVESLEVKILQGNAALPSLDADRHDIRPAVHLPATRRTLIGRESITAEIVSRVHSERLITLTGLGGIGKTSVAVEVASSSAASFPDGVVLVDLSPLRDSELVWPAIFERAGFQASGQQDRQALAVSLANRSQLLLLDNCEHVLQAAANAVHDLLTAGAKLHILATSREPLGIIDEAVVPLHGLDTGPGGPAQQLLLERARLAGTTRPFDDQTSLDAVSSICEHLDGIPLAIELAATQLVHLSPTELLERLHQRFTLLRSGGIGRPPRQRTLAALMEWTWDLLTADQRHVLIACTTFPGDWNLEAIEQIAQDAATPAHSLAAAVLGDLVAKHLITIDNTRPRTRYGMLETVRLYAEQRVGSEPISTRAKQRHADWYVARLEDDDLVQRHLARRVALDVQIELDNLRAAFDWSMQQRAFDAAAIICTGGGFLWFLRTAVADGVQWTRQLLPCRHELHPQRRAELLIAAADAAYGSGDYDAMRHHAGEALHWATESAHHAAAAIAAGIMSQGLAIPEPLQAARLIDLMADHSARYDSTDLHGYLLCFQAQLAGMSGDDATALPLALASIEHASGPSRHRLVSEDLLAALYLWRAAPSEARPILDGQLEAWTSTESQHPPVSLLFERACCAAAEHNDGLLRSELTKAVHAIRHIGATDRLVEIPLALGYAAALRGDRLRATRLLAAVHGKQLNDQLYYEWYRRIRTLVRDLPAISDSATAQARADGSTTDLTQLIEYELDADGESDAGPWVPLVTGI
ncbi:MAG: BTAD domain-containing putative transcriptional regulator [Acidimicrobiales bacterium]